MWTEMGGKERYERRRRWFEENRQQFLDVVGWPLIGLSSGPLLRLSTRLVAVDDAGRCPGVSDALT